jgi:PAS domain S-box-containing protein
MGTPRPRSQDERRTKAELVAELEDLRGRLRELEAAEAERGRLAAALHESEETARALLNAPANVAFLIDPAGKILACNEPAEQRTHLTAKELRGRSLWEVLPPVVVPRRKAAVEDAVTTRRSIHFDEVREPATFENYMYPLVDAEGRVERVGVFCWSIEERRRLEEVLRKPAKEFKARANVSPEAAFELDETGRIIYANAAAARRFGYDGERDIMGRPFRELLGVGEGEAAPRDILPWEGEFTALKKDGGKFAVLLRAAAEGAGRGRTVRILAADITERKRVEKALRGSEDVTRALAATESRFAMVVDAEGQVVALNDPSLRRLVRPHARAVGTSFLEYFPDDVAASKRRWMAEVLRTGKPVLFYDESGGAAYENDIYPILDAGGKVARLAYFAREVTERKRLEFELAAYRRLLGEPGAE